MYKYLFFFALSISLFSCQTQVKDRSEKNADQNVIDLGTQPDQQSYETFNSEEQANQFNADNQDQSQEIEVQDRVFFSLNSSEVEEEAKKILDVQAEWLRSDTSINITIEGHCDERGSREYNIALGEKRAFAVKKYLKLKGVADSRIKIISYGKEKPAFIGTTDEIHNKNRRAVTVVN